MPRQLFTAADVRRVVREQKSAVLVLGPADLITPEAVDVARELGLRLVHETPGAAEVQIDEIVRRVLAELGKA